MNVNIYIYIYYKSWYQLNNLVNELCTQFKVYEVYVMYVFINKHVS